MSKTNAYLNWLNSHIKHGSNLTSYGCPNCREILQTLVPDISEQYDSMTICPYCDKVYFKTVTEGGEVSLTIPTEEIK